MSQTPNRIVLISHGRHDEAVVGTAFYPGMYLREQSDGTLIPHDQAGGTGPLLVAKEEALRGIGITTALTVGDSAPFQRPTRGDRLLMLLKNGQSVSNQDALISAGDGTLMLGLKSRPAQILAPSTTITNTASETAFSNGSYTIPAYALLAGDTIRVRGKVFCIAENSTNTHRIKVYLGATAIADSGALQLAASDVVEFDCVITVRTVGASGTYIVTSSLFWSVSGTFTSSGSTIASTAIDTTATNAVTVKSTASAASTGNQVRLDEFVVDLGRAYGNNPLVFAAEAINNSTGTGTGPSSAAFIRVDVP